MAAALEQAKLNPLIAMPKDHALVGLWLTDETLPGPFTAAPETLRKRADLHDLVLIETTLVTEHPTPSFAEALADGRRALNQNADTTYAGTVDIRRAREHGIRPLALDYPTGTTSQPGDTAERTELGHEEPPAPLIEADTATRRETARNSTQPSHVEAATSSDQTDTTDRPVPGETPDARVDRWLRQLLDGCTTSM